MRSILTGILFFSLLGSSHAAINIGFVEDGANVQMTVSGNIPSFSSSSGGDVNLVGLSSNQARIFTGEFWTQTFTYNFSITVPWDSAGSISPSAAIGTGGFFFSDSSNQLNFYAPVGYTAGQPINASATLNGTSLSALGFSPAEIAAGSGSLSSGTNTTITWTAAVPEPSTALLGLGGIALMLRRRRT